MKKSEAEIKNEFYKWTLEEAKKQNVGQDVIFFRYQREQFAKVEKLCWCGKKINPWSYACPKCIIDGVRKENHKLAFPTGKEGILQKV